VVQTTQGSRVVEDGKSVSGFFAHISDLQFSPDSNHLAFVVSNSGATSQEMLAERHPEKADLVKLSYFAGLTADQTAAAMGLSPSTADRH
jgi:DNA-directed RNA polymerase specialized sigma24 family protein